MRYELLSKMQKWCLVFRMAQFTHVTKVTVKYDEAFLRTQKVSNQSLRIPVAEACLR